MKLWESHHNGNQITIICDLLSESLYINGDLQDQTNGIRTHTSLHGALPDGSPVKVTLGGVFQLHCRLFVNYELIHTHEKLLKIQ